MSYNEFIITTGEVLSGLQPPTGSLVKPVGNSVNVLGDGINILTSGSGNTVTTSTADDIYLASTIDKGASMTIGNLRTSYTNTTNIYGAFIENFVSNEDIILRPAGTGRITLKQGILPVPNQPASISKWEPTTLHVAQLGRGNQTISGPGSILMGGGKSSSALRPRAVALTAGTGVTITNAAGSVTISATGSSGTQAGAYEWQVNTFTGTQQKSFTVDRNDGLLANSSIVGPPTDPSFDFESTSPIEYTIDSVADWELGDSFHVMSSNKGNFTINMPEDVSIFHTGFKMNKSSPKDFLTTTLVKKSATTGQAAYMTSGNPVYPATPSNGVPIAPYFNGAVGTYVGELSFAVSLNAGEPPTLGTREKAFVIVDSIGLVRATNATPQTTNFISYE